MAYHCLQCFPSHVLRYLRSTLGFKGPERLPERPSPPKTRSAVFNAGLLKDFVSATLVDARDSSLTRTFLPSLLAGILRVFGSGAAFAAGEVLCGFEYGLRRLVGITVSSSTSSRELVIERGFRVRRTASFRMFV